MQQNDNGKNPANGETINIDLSELKEALHMFIDQGCEVLKEFSKKPLELGEDALNKVTETSKKAIEKGKVSAKEHPVAALLIAFGLGFLVVKFLNRKKK